MSELAVVPLVSASTDSAALACGDLVGDGVAWADVGLVNEEPQIFEKIKAAGRGAGRGRGTGRRDGASRGRGRGATAHSSPSKAFASVTKAVTETESLPPDIPPQLCVTATRQVLSAITLVETALIDSRLYITEDGRGQLGALCQTLGRADKLEGFVPEITRCMEDVSDCYARQFASGQWDTYDTPAIDLALRMLRAALEDACQPLKVAPTAFVHRTMQRRGAPETRSSGDRRISLWIH